MIMYKPNKIKGINRYILESRQKTNAVLVPADETGVRAIFKHLKQGGLTVILPDHLPKPSGGIYAHFFSKIPYPPPLFLNWHIKLSVM